MPRRPSTAWRGRCTLDRAFLVEGRKHMKITKLSQPVETLKITLRSTSGSQGVLEIAWGTTQAAVSVKLA